jgi:Gpi18-like mannosyltransferase
VRSRAWPWGVALTTRLAIFIVCALTVTTLGLTLKPFQFRISRHAIENLPARFDAGWYLGIARRGYVWSEEKIHRPQNVAFFPLYPMLMRVGGEIVTIPAKIANAPEMLGGGDARVIWGGVLVSLICFTIALGRVQDLAQFITGDGQAARATVLLQAVYPFGIFFGQAYSEALFLLAAVSMTLAWKQQRLGSALGWGLAAGLTRSNGWTLSLAFLLDLVVSRSSSSRGRQIAAALAPLAGAALFTLYVWQLTGHPLAWVQAQEAWSGQFRPFAFITSRVDLIAMTGIWGYVTGEVVDVVTVLSVLASLAAAILLTLRREWLLAAIVVVYLAPAIVLNMTALGRMTSVLFPVFIAVAPLLKTRWLLYVVAGAFVICQWYFAARFSLWLTPY